jgi:hypothetical protein
MKNFKFSHRLLSCFAFVGHITLCVQVGAAASSEPPEFEVVANSVSNYFQSLSDYRPGDLVSRRNVTEALAAVADVGWEVPDADTIVSQALPDDSFLIRELATPAGKKFMRKIARSAGTYSRLDQLSRISNGKNVVRQLMNDKGGDVLITYMATTKGGRNLGRMMADTPKGTDLNKPTGRIYTADDLLAVLQKVYRESAAATVP